MARGSDSKVIVEKKLLETFENSFSYDKKIIIPMVENGERIQIALSMTCLKTNVEPADAPVHVKAKSAFDDPNVPVTAVVATTRPQVEVTDEEKENLAALLDRLGL